MPGRAVQPTTPTLSPDDLICEWYALCDRAADGVVEHPVLGLVACCERCARDAGQQLLALEGDVEARFLGERPS